MRSRLRAALAAAFVLTAVFAVPSAATAATVTPLADSAPLLVLGSGAANPCPDQCVPFGGNSMDFSFATSAPYWSVVAAYPNPGTDYNIALRDASGPLNSSIFGTAVVDFVAVDSNRRAFGGYTATGVRVGGDVTQFGQYYVEFAQPNQILNPQLPGSPLVPVAMNGFITIRDLFLSAQQTATINISSYRVCPATPDPNVHGEALLMASDPDAPATWTPRRADAKAIASFPSTTRPCTGTMTFTAPVSAWYGLVLLDYTDTGIAVGFSVS